MWNLVYCSVIIIIILSFNLQLYFWSLTLLHRAFNQDLGWGKEMVICILYSINTFKYYLANYIYSTLLRRWYILARITRYFLMCLSVLFLILPRVFTITDTIVVLRCSIFSKSISRSLYLLILLYYWICYYLLALTYQLEGIFFFYSP